MSDLLIRIKAGLAILEDQMHMITKAADMALALGLRDILTETRDEIERLRLERDAQARGFDAAHEEVLRLTADNERLRGLLHTTFGHWLADDNPEELPETCAEIRAAQGVHPGEPFTVTEHAGKVNTGQPSRSVQRRIALQKGEPMPEFDGATEQPLDMVPAPDGSRVLVVNDQPQGDAP